MYEPKIEVLYSYSAFVHASHYRLRFNELTHRAKNLHALCLEGEQTISGFTNLVGDIWFAFYKADSTLVKPFEHAWHLHFLQTLMATEEYNRWHLLTMDDELLSILTTISLTEQLLKYLQMQQTPSFGQKSTEPTEALQHLAKTACASLLLHSTDEAKQCRASIRTVGSINGKRLEEMPLADQFMLADALKSNPLLMKVADMTGKLKKIALKKQKQKQKEMMARQNVALGQEIGRLLPLELANYVMPHTKIDFLRKFAERQAFVFDTKGKDTRGRGPIIICMDESSSMTSIKIESKAFCLALMYIARKQRRDLAIIPFASDVGDIRIFKKGQCNMEQLIHFSEAFLGGGTNYERPLTAALDILQTSKLKKADIIFVTDGSSFLPTSFIEQFNEKKKQRQFECTTVVLKNRFNAVDMQLVHRFSNKVIEVDELFEASDVFSIQ